MILKHGVTVYIFAIPPGRDATLYSHGYVCNACINPSQTCYPLEFCKVAATICWIHLPVYTLGGEKHSVQAYG